MDDAEVDRLWRPEWWERLADARGRRRARHAGRAAFADATRQVVLFAAFALVLLAVTVSDELRAGLGAWLGGAWIALVGLLLLRTRTIAWSTYWGLFALSLGWSAVASVGLGTLASAVSAAGAEAPGPAVGIASFGEEAVKLAPLLLVALLAPGRVSRFSTADWTLVGLASGAAFTAVEEFVRRVGEVGLEGGVPDSFVSFGLLGMQLSYDGEVAYPGHHAATGITAAAVGLGIALVRRGSRDIGLRRAGFTAAGVALPVLVWWLFVVRHAALNAAALASDGIDVDLPGPISVTEALLPAGWGRTATVLVVVVVVLLVDARRLARWQDASLADGPPPMWLDRLLDRTDRWREAGGPARWGAPVVEAGGHLAHVLERDARQLVEVVASPPVGTNRWSAVGSSRTLLTMQREMRQIVQHLDGAPARPSVVRSVAAVAVVVLAASTFVVAPAVADDVQSAADVAGSWMAGLLQQLDAWWRAAGAFERTVVAVGTVAAAALSFASPGGTSLRSTTPVGAVAALCHGAIAAGLQAVSTAPPTMSPWVAVTDVYRADPVAWRAEQTARLSAGGR